MRCALPGQDDESVFRFYRKLLLALTRNKLSLVPDESEICVPDGLEKFSEHEISGPEDLESIKSDVDGRLRGMKVDESKVFDVVVSVSEAVSNVLKHAERGVFRGYASNDLCFVVVSDCGAGMRLNEIPLSVQKGRSSKDSLGMGFSIMLELADLLYLCTGSDGTALGLSISLKRGACEGLV